MTDEAIALGILLATLERIATALETIARSSEWHSDSETSHAPDPNDPGA